MKNLFLNIINFLKTLTLFDYILYFAILILIILVASLVYLLKTTNLEEEEEKLDVSDEFDINSTIAELSESKPQNINLTDYEKEQEEKAIISYEELVSSIKKNKINYETDEIVDNQVSVKKVNLDDLISTEEENTNLNVKVMNFEHEEAFLEALKKLQKLLN